MLTRMWGKEKVILCCLEYNLGNHDGDNWGEY